MPNPLKGQGPRAARTAATLAISAAGGLAASYAGMPAAWIAGGLIAVAAASLAGFATEMPAGIRMPIYFLIGLYSGSGVSPETLKQMQTWPGSFAILALSVAALIASSYWWLHNRSGWDRNTALLASLPGALNFVLAAAEGLKADMKKVTLSQSIRILALVELIPLLAAATGLSGGGAERVHRLSATPLEILLLVAVGIVAGFLFEKLRLPGGWMLGGLFASATLLLSGTVSAGLPSYVALPAMVGLAAVGGSRFRPGDLAYLPALARPALVAFAIAIVVSGVSAALVAFLFRVSFLQALLAFAPGALDALVIISYEMNVDPAYVAAHHVARFIGLVIAVPFVARWLARGQPAKD